MLQALFSEDIMRIIQVYLDDEEETRCTRKKAVNSARSVFVKVNALNTYSCNRGGISGT